MSALDGGPRSATATALEPVEVIAVSREAFTGFLERTPGVALVLARMIARRLRDADGEPDRGFLAGDTVGRLCSRLVELADRFGEAEGDGVHIELAITQEELAGWTGSSREAVIRALRTLRELGWDRDAPARRHPCSRSSRCAAARCDAQGCATARSRSIDSAVARSAGTRSRRSLATVTRPASAPRLAAAMTRPAMSRIGSAAERRPRSSLLVYDRVALACARARRSSRSASGVGRSVRPARARSARPRSR